MMLGDTLDLEIPTLAITTSLSKSMLNFLFSTVLTVLLTGVITLASTFYPPHAEAAVWNTPMGHSFAQDGSPIETIAVLPGLKGLFTSTPPENIGIHDQQLAPCPSTPNCIMSQTIDDEEHGIDPIAYQTTQTNARDLLLKVLSVVPRTEVIEQSENYIRVESTSRLMGFVDDGEFYFPADESVIQVRFAARLGESDLGVNRRRVEQIRLAMEDLGA